MSWRTTLVTSPKSSKLRRGPGRPRNTKKAPPDLHQHVWVSVECRRWGMRDSSGRLESVSQACRALARRGGLNWIIGGDVGLLARKVRKKDRSKAWQEIRQVNPKRKGAGVRLVNDRHGQIFLQHSIQEASSIRARYNEAAEMLKHDPDLKWFWTNIFRGRVGLPALPRNDWRRRSRGQLAVERSDLG
jgi:hypothetical protein